MGHLYTLPGQGGVGSCGLCTGPFAVCSASPCGYWSLRDQDEPGGPYTCLELTLVPTGPPDPSEAWLVPLKP